MSQRHSLVDLSEDELATQGTEKSDVHLIRNQLPDGTPRNGDVTRPFSVVSHEHVDRAIARIKKLSQTQ